MSHLNTSAAYKKLKHALSDPHVGSPEKSIAADALAFTDPEGTLKALQSLLKDEFFTGPDPHFIAALEHLGPKARDLLPALKEAETTARNKVAIQEMIKSIK